MKKKTVSIISLGCFRNTYDSEIVLKRFIDNGYVFKRVADKVDALIINTCGFIKDAKEESLEYIQRAVELKNKKVVGKIIVMGCLVERYMRDLRKVFPSVDEWHGVENFPQSILFPPLIMPRHIGFLKISEGCDNNCSYCAIPLIKGGLVSKRVDSVLEEVKYMDKRGVKEVNIIGQDVTSWGKDLAGEKDLVSLLKSILKKTRNIRWFRIMYTHPRFFTRSLIDLIANEERICKYIDLPIQHINDRILKMMNRNMTREEIISLIKAIRRKIKNAAIRTSLIVGFPTETDTEFKELLDFIKKTEFENMGAFIYSREETTPAYKLRPRVHYKIKQKRLKEIMALQKSISYKRNKSMIGSEINVLVDKTNRSISIGRGEFSAYDVDGVVYIKRKKVKEGEFYKLKVIDNSEYDLIAQ